MSVRELDAAGVADPALRASYERCRRLNAAHGQTYYLATLLLPPQRRPAVHALYGFARYADEIVDDLASPCSVAERSARLAHWGGCFLAGLDAPPGERPADSSGLLPAVWDTARRYGLAAGLFADFLASMRMDLTVACYPTYSDLLRYVHGSAGVIGLQMVPVLGTVGPAELAEPYAYDLGIAFQLANFIRDVGEDLRRGRVYLPLEDLEAFQVTREQLLAGVVDSRVRRLFAFEVARTRELFRAARPGIRLLDPRARDCVQVAFTLYGGILDAVEAADYAVLDRRVRVGMSRRARVALPGLWRSWRARAGVSRRTGSPAGPAGRPALPR